MQNNIYALIVIYNKSCRDSVSYDCLKKTAGINIIVCDNSTSDFGNQETVTSDNNIYLSLGGNKGLSAAYNKALEYLSGKDGWLCIFDDDTEIPHGYFDELNVILAEEKYDICLPQVFCKTGLMSPVSLKKYAVKKIDDISKTDYKSLAGINSGMAISLKLIEDYRYDERLFLDFVDYNFILDMRKKNARIKIMDSQLTQSFSNDGDDKNAFKARLKIKKKDLRYFYRSTFISRLFYVYLISKLKARLVLKFKDFGAFWW